MKSTLKAGGIFTFEQFRNGKIIDEWGQENLVPEIGINKLLDTSIGGVTAITPWYIALFSNVYTPQSDDLYEHIGVRYTEVTAYNETTRPVYSLDGLADAGLLSNSNDRALFTFNADQNVSGGLIVSANAKGDNAAAGAILLAASAHSPARGMLAGDELLVKYEFQMTSA